MQTQATEVQEPLASGLADGQPITTDDGAEFVPPPPIVLELPATSHLPSPDDSRAWAEGELEARTQHSISIVLEKNKNDDRVFVLQRLNKARVTRSNSLQLIGVGKP